MSLLFDTPLIDGLRYAEDVISATQLRFSITFRGLSARGRSIAE